MQSYLRRDVTGCCRLSHEKFNVEDNDVFILFCFFLTFFRVEKGGKKKLVSTLSATQMGEL